MPDEHELTHLLEDSPKSFAGQLFDYMAILFKTLADLLSYGNPNFSVLYTEVVTLNLRTPTKVITPLREGLHNIASYGRRIRVDRVAAQTLHDTMRKTLKATSQRFRPLNANECDRLFPLIQIGSLRFATEGQVWGEGHNLVLAHDDFQWLRY
ncbi:Nn.00g047830.m01.CDS01 [Neocucurbitaria sp. VM-36]